MPDRREVDADLMRAAGLEHDRDQRSARRGDDRLDVRDRATATVADAELDRTDAHERRVDGLLLAELALADREVALADAFALELARQLRVDVRAPREKDDTARPTVEALHEEHRPGLPADELVQKGLVGLVHALLHDESGRLVDEDERVVFVEHCEMHDPHRKHDRASFVQRSMSRSLRLLALCLLFARVGHAQEHAQEIDRILEQQVRELHIPGAALAIVKDDRVVYVKTIGLRDVEHNLAVSEETIFPIGSCTKAFTSMAIALSADRGLLSLDDHPQKYLPYLKLADPDANARITIRDMLSHRTGLPAKNDLAAEPGVLTREEYIRAATSVTPAAPFGTQFLYSNAMFAAAGEIVAKVNHDTWEHVIARDIFKPLAMPSSVADLRDAKHATGYVWDGKAWQAVAPSPSMQALAPAGSIASSVRDMAQWVRMLANGGRGFVSEKMFRELTTPLMKVNDTTSYALGWATYDWNGLHVVEHNGGSTGISALVAFIPERRVGFVFLANTSPTAMTKIGNAGQMLWPLILPDDAPNASRIVARMIEAAGGETALRAHTSVEIHALKNYEEHGVLSEMTIHAKAPASRNELDILKAVNREIGRVRVYFDGAHGGQETTFGQDSINDDAANAKARRDDTFPCLLDLGKPTAHATDDAWVLDLEGGTHLFVSKQTGLITKRESEGEVATFDDYRNVDGEMVPFHTTIHDGLGTSTIFVQSVKFNVPIGEAMFKPTSP